MAINSPATPILNGNPIRPRDSADPGEVAWADEVRGGHHQKPTIEERNAITMERRKIGMLATVNGVTYRLEGTLENDGWTDILGDANQRTSALEEATTAAADDIATLEGRADTAEGRLDAGDQRAATLETRADATDQQLYQLGQEVAGATIGDSFVLPTLADLTNPTNPSGQVNTTGQARYGSVYADSTSANNGRYAQENGSATWAKVAGDVTGRVSTLEQKSNKIIAPITESYDGIVMVEMDRNRRAFRKWHSDGTTSLKLNDDSIPDIGRANLKDDVSKYLPADDDYIGWLEVELDKNKRLIRGLRPDGTTFIRLAPDAVSAASLEDGAVQTGKLADEAVTLPKLEATLRTVFPSVDDYNGWSEIHLDANGRLLRGTRSDGSFYSYSAEGDASAEVVEARGTAASLNARLSGTLTPAGYPDVEMWGRWNLRSFSAKKAQLRFGASLLLSVGSCGDSWRQNSGRSMQEVARALQAALGDGGAGFYGFGFYNDLGGMNGCADGARISGTRDTGWSLVYNVPGGVYALDGMHIASSTVGKGVSLNINSAHASCRIHYRQQPGGGTFRYRVASGSWVSVSTDGADGYGLHAVVIPASAFSLRIEIEAAGSSGVILNGIDCRNTSGVVVHKMALSGGTAGNFVDNVNAAHWQAGIAALELDLTSFMFGTNEQNQNVPPATLAANLQTLGTRAQTALPLCDLMYSSPCINGLTGKSYTMPQYRDAIYSTAVAMSAGFLDLIKSFGPSFAAYAASGDGSTRNLFNPDLIHPEPATGGKQIADREIKFLLE